MKNRVFSLLLALSLAASLGVSAYAANHQGTDHTVKFTKEKKMEQDFSEATIADDFKDESVQPGDTLTLKINVLNEYKGSTVWYMNNAVVKSFEDTGTAQGSTKSSAYTYTLTYYPPSGAAQLLYDNHDVGGDTEDYSDKKATDNTTTRGLGEATQGLQDFFRLDTFKEGQGGYLTLVVHLDGETEGNSYQDTLAKLKMQFAVELDEEETPTPSTTTTTPPAPSSNTPTTPPRNTTTTNRTTPTPTSNTTTRNAVRTGDEFNLVPYVIAACVSGLLLLAVLIFLVKKRAVKEEKGGR